MASISLSCPECDAVLKLAARPAAGKKVKCPKCGASFVADDDEVADAGAAVKSAPDRPTAKGRPSRTDDDDDEKPTRRKSRADLDEDDDDRPRRGKGRRDPDDDDDDRPRRAGKAKSSGNMGLIIGLCIGGAALLLLLAVVGLPVLFFLLLAAPVHKQVAMAPMAEVAVKDQPALVAKAPVDNVPPVQQQPKQKGKPKREPKPKPVPVQPPPQPAPVPVAEPVDLDQAVLDKISRATTFIQVSLGNQAASGSGFLVRTNGDTAYIITNFHVIALEKEEPEPAAQPKGRFGPKFGPQFGPKFGPKFGPRFGPPSMFGPKKKSPDPNNKPRITVVFDSGTPQEQSLSADIVATDPEGDLAALRVTRGRNLPAPIDVSQEAPVAQDQSIYIFGFPANKRPKGPGNPPVNVGKGRITTLRRDAASNEINDVHIDGELNPGNSGGPVVDAQGRLVGVAVSTVVGKRIGFAIPAVELFQMFKGRVSAGLVLQVKQQGFRLDVIGERWIHDRKNSIRLRDVLNVPIANARPGEIIPTNEFTVLAGLADPMLKIGKVSAYYAITENVPVKPGADGWTPLAAATPVPMKIEGDVAVGTFKLPPAAVRDQTYAFQFSFVNADGKTVFTQPHLVRLTFPAKAKSVTINIAGIPSDAHRRYIEEKSQTSFGAAQARVKSKSANSLVLEVDPVPDPSVINGQVQSFGTVASVQGRTFEVTCKKFDLPAPSDAEISSALDELKSSDKRQRTSGADKLAKVYVIVPARQKEVAKALEPLASDKDIWAAKAALRALAVWGTPDCIPAILPALSNNFTRGEARETLGKFKDPRAAEALANLLPGLGDRASASAALKRMGAMAEKYVIPYAKHKDIFTAQEACRILQEIGTAECIPTLTEIANGNNNFVKNIAREALKTVQARTK